MANALERLTDLRRKINGSEYVTPGENSLADDLMSLCDIVADVARQTEANRRSADYAANAASCLANGMKPD